MIPPFKQSFTLAREKLNVLNQLAKLRTGIGTASTYFSIKSRLTVRLLINPLDAGGESGFPVRSSNAIGANRASTVIGRHQAVT